MKLKVTITTLIVMLLCIAAFGLLGCGGKTPEPSPTPTPSPTPSPPPSTPEPTPEPVHLVPYDGIVEHIFFHEIIAWPEKAFGGNQRSALDIEMVTAFEFVRILEELRQNNYILIDLNDVWSEFINDNGHRRMRQNELMLPEGKRPLVISFDDLSFYNYMSGHGFMDRYVVGIDGDIWAEGTDPNGNYIISQDLAAVTILDKFVRENPDFSLGGAKGCIAFTGYEGILGYRTQSSKDDASDEFRLNRMQEIARVQPVVQRLKETGWYFATHSFGHIRIARASLATVQADAERWLDEVGSLVGPTQIFIYPFGERLDGDDSGSPGPAFRFYVDLGFRLFASVGSRYYTEIKADVTAVRMDRMLVGGRTLRHQPSIISRFFDPRDVFDPARPEEYGNSWE